MKPSTYYEVFVRWPDGTGEPHRFYEEQSAADKFLQLQQLGYAGGRSSLVVRKVTTQDMTQEFTEVLNNDRR